MLKESYVLEGGRLVLPDRVIEGGSLVVEDGAIGAIIEAGGRLPEGLPQRAAAGRWVTPGLMETHIHGAGGLGFENLGDGPECGAASLKKVRDFLLARGVTAFLPTLVAERAALRSLAAAIEAADLEREVLPGIYLEGPFVNPKRRGGIPAELLLEPDLGRLDEYLADGGGLVRLMTMAPELPGAQSLAARLRERGVTVCLGHSDAILGRFKPPEPPFSVTHLFNAMSPISHKDPGLAMLPFLDSRPYVELISDGVHVNDYALRLAAKGLDPERLILISDAAAAAGLPPGEYEFLGRKVVSGPRGVRYADSGTLMGSRCLGPELLRHWIEATGAPVHEAVRALSLNPRRLLGIENRGALAVGMDADLVVWEGDFERPAFVSP
jgi:N-acetylglucosamine-6-phosphate deacetylase